MGKIKCSVVYIYEDTGSEKPTQQKGVQGGGVEREFDACLEVVGYDELEDCKLGANNRLQQHLLSKGVKFTRQCRDPIHCQVWAVGLSPEAHASIG